MKERRTKKLNTISLRMKFIFGLVLSAGAFGICLGIIMYFHYNSIMESQVSQRSKMLLAQSDAVQDYVKSVLRPKMFEQLPPDRFIIQAMSSSYVTRQVMARLNTQDALDYHYRRVSIKPRNPASAANEFEKNLITQFNADKTMTFWEDTTLVNQREYHLVARPVTFVDACMQCHGSPSDAPKELIEKYGPENGFYYQPNEVSGVVVAGFPVDMIKNPSKELTIQYLSLYLLGILFFAVIISLFFDRLVIRNLQQLTRIFRTRFSGEQEQSIIKRLGEKDEIEGLVEGVDELAVCLSEARHELEDYAQNLERMVQDRTKALDLKAQKHLGDVRLFVTLLSKFASSNDTRQLVSSLLQSVGKRYNADQTVYYCAVVSENYYAWQPKGPIPPMPANAKDLLWNDEILLEDRQLYIPVKSPESHWGILTLSWKETPDPEELDPAILLALGQQVAILIENIHAFTNIRYQHDMLQSVFKGISDPLMLIDENCHIIIANQGSTVIANQDTLAQREAQLKAFLGLGQGEKTILEEVIASGKSVKEEIRTADNRYFDVELYPLAREDQSDMRMVLYAREITQEKEMLDRMQQAERLSSIGKMAAGVAHEINNPLGVIQIYADLVKDSVDDEEVQKDVGVILKHTKSAKSVVQNLLNLSRPKKTLSGTCDLNAVIESEIPVFKTQANPRNIDLTFTLTTDLPMIQCDAAIVEQILTNLWLNAMDALQESGDRISIKTEPGESNEVCLTLSDNGPGIADHILDHIFDPFFTTKDVGKGTGLGLSVVYGFITELGGRITVESRQGTTFKIFFPAVTTRQPDQPAC